MCESEVIISFPPPYELANRMGQLTLGTIFMMLKFFYNNTMHLATQQTSFFVNHGLHPKFDIQNVHKVMNLIIKDRAMWLVDV